MKTKTKILDDNKVHITIKDFEIIPCSKKNDMKKYKECRSKLILIFEHILRFDIKDKELMHTDRDLRLYELKIDSINFDGTHNQYINLIKDVIQHSLCKKSNKIITEYIQFFIKKRNKLEIIYGYNE